MVIDDRPKATLLAASGSSGQQKWSREGGQEAGEKGGRNFRMRKLFRTSCFADYRRMNIVNDGRDQYRNGCMKKFF